MAVKQKVGVKRRKVVRPASKTPASGRAASVRRKKSPARRAAPAASADAAGPRAPKPFLATARVQRQPWPVAVLTAAVGVIGWVTGCRYSTQSQPQDS